jgi:hypothetical protein
MEDRAQAQIALERAEGLFDLLDPEVEEPQFAGVATDEVPKSPAQRSRRNAKSSSLCGRALSRHRSSVSQIR